jgi:hypothetical protein
MKGTGNGRDAGSGAALQTVTVRSRFPVVLRLEMVGLFPEDHCFPVCSMYYDSKTGIADLRRTRR